MKFKKVILTLLPVLLLFAACRTAPEESESSSRAVSPSSGGGEPEQTAYSYDGDTFLRQYREAQKRVGAGGKARGCRSGGAGRKRLCPHPPAGKPVWHSVLRHPAAFRTGPHRGGIPSAGGGHGRDFPEGIADAEVFPDRPGGGRGLPAAEPGPCSAGKSCGLTRCSRSICMRNEGPPRTSGRTPGMVTPPVS